MNLPVASAGQQLVRVLVAAFQSTRLYPEAHPVRAQAEERVRAIWGALLAQGQEVVLDLYRSELLIGNDPPERIPNDLTTELGAAARSAGMAEVRFEPFAPADRVIEFLRRLGRTGSERLAANATGAFRIMPSGPTATGSIPVVRNGSPAPVYRAPAPGQVPAPAPPPPPVTPIPVATQSGGVPRPSSTGSFRAATVSGGLAVPTAGAGLPVPPPDVRQALHLLANCWIAIEQAGRRDEQGTAWLIRFVLGQPGDGISRPVTLIGGTTASHPVLEHALDVARVTALAARAAGLSGYALEEVIEAALCADIGMRSVPLELLQRPMRFSQEDFRAIRQHTVLGARWLLATPGVPELAGVVAFEHHMRPDGKGYPQPPRAWMPHPVTLLVQAADTYTALRTSRPFRPSLGEAEARQLVRKLGGGALDARAAELLLTRAVPAGCSSPAS